MYKPTMTTAGSTLANYLDWGDNTIPYPPYSNTTYSWSYPTKALITIEEAETLRKAAKKDKKLAAVLSKLTPYIEVQFGPSDFDDED